MTEESADRQPECGLPADLEERAHRILLDRESGRSAAFAALATEHPEHADALARLRADYERGTALLGESGTPPVGPLPPPIGPYTFVRQIGEGGFGVVFLAEQEVPIRRQVAIKLMHPRVYSQSAITRFLNERATLARMDHPAIGRIHDAGVDSQGNPYFVMEYVPGEPLHDFVQRARPDLRTRIDLFLAVCAAITHAHQRGVIHRDLKPANVLVTATDGVLAPKVIDFGLAKVLVEQMDGDTPRTGAGVVLGTPAYMSPEQLRGDAHDLDVRTDVYSLGVMLYEILAGQRPFGADHYRASTIAELRRRLDSEEPPLVSVRAQEIGVAHAGRLRGELDWILRKAMARSRDERYASVADFAADLRRHLAHEPVEAGPPSFAYVLRKFVRRHRVPVAAAFSVLASLVVALVVSVTQDRRARANERRANENLADFWRLADLVELEELVEEERKLWPSSTARFTEHERWLARALALLGRRAIHEQRARELETRLADPTQARASAEEERGSRFLAQSLRKVLAGLADLEREGGPLQNVQKRAEFARTVEQRSLVEVRPAWERVRATVASSPRYGGLRLAPIAGLVPLGPDPKSGLEEFAHLQSGTVPLRSDDGTLTIAPDTGIVFVLVPGGIYPVGTQADDANKGHYDPHRTPIEIKLRKVRLEAYLIGKYELTQGQAKRLFWTTKPTLGAGGALPGGGRATDRHPIETLLGPDVAATLAHFECRLPSLTEWEVAARAGSSAIWVHGDTPESLQGYANVADATVGADKDTSARPWDPSVRDGCLLHAPVGSFLPNAFGLHDVIGNVSELTLGDVPLSGEPRFAARGGSYMLKPMDCRVGALRIAMPNQTTPEIGVRVARSLETR